MLARAVVFRYLRVTCKNVSYRIHVRNFILLSSRGKKCSTESSLCSDLATTQQLRHLASRNKKIRIRIPPLNSDAQEKSKPMSDYQASLTHVSYGGQFEVSSNENINNDCPLYESGSSNSSGVKPSTTTPPDFRIWEEVGSRSDSNTGSSFKFKVVSYNVLAQCLLEYHPYLYTGCHPHNLKWKVRAPRLFDEIVKLSPDIICLQEVQATHLGSFYAKFEKIGYTGIFKQKTGHREDGCAIYYKQDLFEKSDQCSVEYYQPGLSILNRDNIGMMVKLVPRCMPFLPIVVATTHLLYNPKRTDVRLAQLQVLLAELDRFAYNGRESGHLPIILTGDLNSTPESAVIQLLDRGYVSASAFRDSSDWKRIGVTDNCQHLSVVLDRLQGKPSDFSDVKIYNSEYSKDVPGHVPSPSEYGVMFNSGAIGHSLKLVSAYDRCKLDGRQEASTFQDRWVTVDYVYYSYCNNLNLLERLRLPTTDECETLGCLPNEKYASDHLALAALFELKPTLNHL
ncbi:protein angel homolog 1 isoform X2 [Plodia interpunctella]|uniref:protein angel homolog 1 isoform X2 n=1 Tax=Plodia interpunctella TaxID=58824 RepID=UPI00236777A1|nr:protein angel homolog 1 isoform X2 [Plodia interpunctella]